MIRKNLMPLSILAFVSALAFGANYSRFDDLIIKNTQSIGSNTTPDSKAVLDVVSTTKGFLPPRMTTTQRDAITSPTEGLHIYNSTTHFPDVYNASAWKQQVDISSTQTLIGKSMSGSANTFSNLPATGLTGLVPLANGGTNADLSATGGTSRVLKQTSTGAAVTVAQLACSDLSNSTTSCSTANATANTASTLVARDGSGNFAAGTVTAALTGTVTGSLVGNASTATALAADPADCAGNTYATTINASGTLGCASITNASTTAVSTNTNSTIVLRDGSGNFSAGTISAALTGTASGNLTASANNHGVLLSSATNAATVVAPNASTAFPLVSGGASADPTWALLTVAGGGTGLATLTAHNVLTGNGTGTLNSVAPGTSGNVLSSNGTDWISAAATAGGGAGTYEFCTNTGAEVDTAGWATYNDAAATTPVDGTGGSPSATLTRTTAGGEVIRGTASFKFAKGATNRQGDGFSFDLTADAAEGAVSRPIYFSLDYFESAAYVAGDLQLFAYDKTNGTLLTVYDSNGLSGAIPATTTFGRFTGKFYSVAGVTSYRVIGHVASTNASAWNFFFDTIHVGGANIVPGSIITPTRSWTPTGSWVSNTTYTGLRHREGQYEVYDIKVTTSGAPTSATLTVNIPTDVTIDTAQVTNAGAGLYAFPDSAGVAVDSGSRSRLVICGYNSSTVVTPYSVDATGGAGITQAAPFTFGAADFVQFTCKVPILGWSDGASVNTSETLFQNSSWSGYHDNTCTWTRTNTSYGDPATDATCALVERKNNNFGTVTSVAGLLPGITFTPNRPAWYWVCAQAKGFNSTLAQAVDMRLWDGTTTIAESENVQQVAANGMTFQMCGLYKAASTAAVTLSVQVKSTANQVSISANAANASALEWTLVQIPDFSAFSVFGSTELVESTAGTATYTITAGQQGDLTSISLTPGEWDIDGQAVFNSNGAVTTTIMFLGISTTSGNSATGLTVGDAEVVGTKTLASGYYDTLRVFKRGVVITAPTTYYLKARADNSITNLSVAYKISARRIK